MAKNKKEETQKKTVENENVKDNQNKKAKKQNVNKDNSKKDVKKEKKVSSKAEKSVNKQQKVSKEAIEAEKQIENRFSKNGELAKLIKIVLIVTAIMLVFYLITLVATDKADKANSENSSKNDDVANTEIQYDYIMIGTMLNRGGTYYILIEEDEDNRLSEYSTLIETVKANEDAPSIYKANLTDAFNKGYLSKEANYDVTDIADFRVTGTTLVKIKDNEITDTYDTYDAIKTKLKELSE